jgi:hypothetical protein
MELLWRSLAPVSRFFPLTFLLFRAVSGPPSLFFISFGAILSMTGWIQAAVTAFFAGTIDLRVIVGACGYKGMGRKDHSE